MSFGDLRVALYLAYAILVAWRMTTPMPEGILPYAFAYAVLIPLTHVAEAALDRIRLRRDVSFLASLDPAEAEARIERLWSAHARRTYRELLEQEGAVQQSLMAERFPFASGARRAVDIGFWSATACAAMVFAALFIWRDAAAAAGWALWAIGTVLAGVAGWLRHRGREARTVLEVTPFGIAALTEAGERERMIRWTQPLILQNQPRRQRLVLAVESGNTRIPLHYRRVGFNRLLQLTLVYGGFAPPSTSVEAGAEAAASRHQGDA